MSKISARNVRYLFLLVVTPFLSACGQQNISRDCPINDLLLIASDLPIGSTINDVSSPVAEYPEESAGITASYNNDLIYHVVGRYPSNNTASRKFSQSFDLRFGKDSYGQPWETPNELSFVSLNAQQYAVACGNVSGKLQCRMIGQYEEYYIFFFSYISEQGINLETFQGFLERIDNKMIGCLK